MNCASIAVGEQHPAVGAAALARRQMDAEAPAVVPLGAGEDVAGPVAAGRSEGEGAAPRRIPIPARHHVRRVGAGEAQLDLALGLALAAALVRVARAFD